MNSFAATGFFWAASGHLSLIRLHLLLSLREPREHERDERREDAIERSMFRSRGHQLSNPFGTFWGNIVGAQTAALGLEVLLSHPRSKYFTKGPHTRLGGPYQVKGRQENPTPVLELPASCPIETVVFRRPTAIISCPHAVYLKEGRRAYFLPPSWEKARWRTLFGERSGLGSRCSSIISREHPPFNHFSEVYSCSTLFVRPHVRQQCLPLGRVIRSCSVSMTYLN